MRIQALSVLWPNSRASLKLSLTLVAAVALVPLAGCESSRSGGTAGGSSKYAAKSETTTKTITIIADAAQNEVRTVAGVGGSGRSDAEIEQDVSMALPHHTREVWVTRERPLTERVTVPRRVHLIASVGGRNAVCPGGVHSPADLQKVFVQRRAEFEAVLSEAGSAGKSADLFAAVAKGEITAIQYPSGTDFAWMALRSNGRVHAASDLRWAGAAPMPAFEVRVGSGKDTVAFAIPEACCNLAMVATPTAAH